MNITELEKIIAQIKKYQLEDEIRDIENWLGKLNKKQIKNFVNISIELHQLRGILKSKSLLVNRAALNGDYYLEDIKFVNDAKTGEIASCLSKVACSKASLESEHHKEDMKLIADAKNAKDANKIYDNIIKQYEVKNKKEESNYVTFQEKVDAIHQNAVEYADGDTTKELDDSVFTLK